MATGDIIAAEILGSPSHLEGWVLELEIEGWSGKTVSAMNLGWTLPDGVRGNDPTTDTPAVVLNLTSPGYHVTGGDVAATTYGRTLYGTRRIRKPYPDQAQFDTADSDGNLKVRIALDDWVFEDDTALTVNILAGAILATDESETNAATDLAVTNSSEKAYPKVQGFWVDSSESLNAVRVGATYRGRFHADAPHGIAACRFIMGDQTSDSEDFPESIVTEPESFASEREDQSTLPRITAYRANMTTTALNQGELGTARVLAYPLIGNAAAVFDSATVTGNGADTHRRSRTHRIDHAGTWPTVYVYADTANGDNSTGVASTTPATARANPYAHMWQALLAARDFINTTYSRSNSLDGVVCRLMDDGGDPQDFEWGRTGFAAGMTAPGAAPIFEPDPENTARVRFRTKTGNPNILCNRFVMRVPVEPASAAQSNYMAGVDADDWYVFDRADLVSESTSASAPILNANVTKSTFYCCKYKDFRTSPRADHLIWIDFQALQTSIGNFRCLAGFVLDALVKDWQLAGEPTNALGFGIPVENRVLASGRVRMLDAPAFGSDDMTNCLMSGMVFVKHSTGDGSEPLVRMAAKSYINFLMRDVTMLGQRMDGPQQSNASHVSDLWYAIGICGPYIAPKSDTFEDDGTVVNGWSSQWCVGWRNWYNGRANTFQFEFDGLHMFAYRTGAPAVNPGVEDLDDDPTPTDDSELRGLLRAGTVQSPRFDLVGTEVPNDGTGYAGALQGPLGDPAVPVLALEIQIGRVPIGDGDTWNFGTLANEALEVRNLIVMETGGEADLELDTDLTAITGDAEGVWAIDTDSAAWTSGTITAGSELGLGVVFNGSADELADGVYTATLTVVTDGGTAAITLQATIGAPPAPPAVARRPRLTGGSAATFRVRIT